MNSGPAEVTLWRVMLCCMLGFEKTPLQDMADLTDGSSGVRRLNCTSPYHEDVAFSEVQCLGVPLAAIP